MRSQKCSKCGVELKEGTAPPSTVKKGNGFCTKCAIEYRNNYRKEFPDRAKVWDKNKADKNLERNKNKNPYAVGGHKVCSKCNFNWPIEFYPIHRHGSTGLHSYCKLCERKRAASTRGKPLNITSEEYRDLLVRQNCKCGICYKEKGYDLAIDHDHKTGKVRGLLCLECNTALGGFQDSSKILENAINYLRESRYATRYA